MCDAFAQVALRTMQLVESRSHDVDILVVRLLVVPRERDESGMEDLIETLFLSSRERSRISSAIIRLPSIVSYIFACSRYFARVIKNM